MKGMWDVGVKSGLNRRTEPAVNQSSERVVFQRQRVLEGQREGLYRRERVSVVWVALKTNWCLATIGHH